MEYLCIECLEVFKGLRSFLQSSKKISKKASCLRCKSNANAISLKYLVKHLNTCIKEKYTYVKNEQEGCDSLQVTVQEHLLSYEQSKDKSEYSDKNPVPNDEHIEFIINTLLKNIEKINGQKSYTKYTKDTKEIAWENFKNLIKTHRRFFFTNKTDALEQIEHIIVSKLKLINTVSKGNIVYRARAFKEGSKIINDLRRMGPPLPEDIKHVSNRMSPPGIPIFYGSFDKITASSEISDIKKNRYTKIIKKNRYVNNRYANIAQFKLLKDIDIIDFTQADSMRVSESIQYQVEKERKILFMRYLGREFSEPIEKDGKEHTEYVPTQIFTEYIKHNIKNIKGIKYNSGKTCGANLALFLDQEHFCDNESKINNHYFFMDSRSTQTIEIPVARSYELSLEGLPHRSSSGKIKIQKTNNSFEFYFAFFDHHSQQTNSIVNCSNKFKVDNQMCSYIKVKWNIPTYEQNILEKFGLNNQDIIQNKMNEEKDITVTKKYNVTLMDELSVAYTQSIFNAIDKIEKLFTAESCYKKLILQGQYHVRSNILEMDGMPSTQLDSKIPGSDADLKELDSSEINEYAKLKQEFSKLNLQ